MSSVVKNYENRQRDYIHAYSIEYRPHPKGFFHIMVLSHPTDPWGMGQEEHHLVDDSYVCVAGGKEPRTVEAAEVIARYWMSKYSEYIRTGSFRDTGGRVNV